MDRVDPPWGTPLVVAALLKRVHVGEGHAATIASETDAAAHAAATSPTNGLPQPTHPQIAAGNYKKGKLRIGGLDISIENPEGSVRESHPGAQKAWRSPIKSAHYGYIKGTEDADKDQLDVFVKPSTPEDFTGNVFVINQVDENGNFDEHKVMLGYGSEKEAVAAYSANYPPDHKVGPVQTMTMDELRHYVSKGGLLERMFGRNRGPLREPLAPMLSGLQKMHDSKAEVARLLQAYKEPWGGMGKDVSTTTGLYNPQAGLTPKKHDEKAAVEALDEERRKRSLGKGGPGSGPHPGNGDKGAKERAALGTVQSSIKSSSEGRRASFDSHYNPGEEDIKAAGNGHELSVRNYGTWQNQPGDRDDDSDHQVPTKATVESMKSIIASAEKQHPDIKFSLSGGEKNYTYIRATHKATSTDIEKGGPGSGPHAGSKLSPSNEASRAADNASKAANEKTEPLRDKQGATHAVAHTEAAAAHQAAADAHLRASDMQRQQGRTFAAREHQRNANEHGRMVRFHEGRAQNLPDTPSHYSR